MKAAFWALLTSWTLCHNCNSQEQHKQPPKHPPTLTSRTNTPATPAIPTALGNDRSETALRTNAWDFGWGFWNVKQPIASTYIVDSKDIGKYTEWQKPPVCYWGPAVTDGTASITMRFPFRAPAAKVFLIASLASFDFTHGGAFGIGKGSCRLWASRDGNAWQLLLDNPAPARTPDSYKAYKTWVPAQLTGAAEFWVRVTLSTQGALSPKYACAQFCRAPENSTTAVFFVGAVYKQPE